VMDRRMIVIMMNWIMIKFGGDRKNIRGALNVK
jgi:hypothetical protein